MAWTRLTDSYHVDADAITMHDRIRARPCAVRAHVIAKQVVSRTVTVPMVTIGSAEGTVDGKIPHTEAGHLIALELGGIDHCANLVPMYGGVNRGTYRAIEGDIANLIILARQTVGAKPAVLVNIHYPLAQQGAAVDPRIPTAFDVYFHANMPDLQQLTSATGTLVRRIENVKLQPVRMEIKDGDIHLRAKLIAIKAAFASRNWKIEDMSDYAFTQVLPALNNRPNAWLDWLLHTSDELATAKLLLSKVSDGQFTVGKGWSFVPQQRMLLAIANCMTQPDHKKGECWSDAAGDPITTALTTLGTDDGIHVDHIFPMASGGPNLYSNASITSALFNKQKGR